MTVYLRSLLPSGVEMMNYEAACQPEIIIIAVPKVKQKQTKVLGELSELQIKALLPTLTDSHWSKSFVCCPVIGQETSRGPVK